MLGPPELNASTEVDLNPIDPGERSGPAALLNAEIGLGTPGASDLPRFSQPFIAGVSRFRFEGEYISPS